MMCEYKETIVLQIILLFGDFLFVSAKAKGLSINNIEYEGGLEKS